MEMEGVAVFPFGRMLLECRDARRNKVAFGRGDFARVREKIPPKSGDIVPITPLYQQSEVSQQFMSSGKI